MNAKEFAHELEKAASFIRQQQAEIEALKAHPVKELTLTHEEYDNIFANGKRLGVIETENRLWKAMQLTDEEIVYLAKRFEGVWNGEIDYKGFARAILRKAQEK